MDFKKAFIRSLIIIAIIIISFGVGVVFQKISVKVDMKNNPLEYAEYVEKYSDEFGVPEYVIYSVIKNQSGFDSSKEYDDGAIGLMKVLPEELEAYKGQLHDSYDTGMLYDPETNIKYGTYTLSRLYIDLGTWKSVYATLYCGRNTVDGWLCDTGVSDITENVKPRLRDIPDKGTRKFVERLEKTAETYKELYFDTNK